MAGVEGTEPVVEIERNGPFAAWDVYVRRVDADGVSHVVTIRIPDHEEWIVRGPAIETARTAAYIG